MNTPIPTITDGRSLPTPLCSRFGEWMDANPDFWPGWSIEKNLQVYAAVVGAFPDPENWTIDDYIEGDPRRHMAREISFVAVKDGSLGLHIEQELDFILADEGGLHDLDHLVERDEFAELETFWQERLQILASQYPQTQFFLAHGEHTYKGRMTLNAWTPYTGQVVYSRAADEVKLSLQQLRSPYQDPADISGSCWALDELAQDIIAISLHEYSNAA